jgi:5-methyltetrahydrofolate--homocysteine methyltransferase
LLDINAGIPLADEPAILAEAIKLVQSITDVPISIDSSIVKALESGLSVYQGKALVNSVTGEEERLEAVLPLIKKYGAAVVAISNDETGISENPEVRLAVAKKIIERAMDYGIPREDVLIDPLVMPIGAMRYAGRQVFEIVRRCRDELKVNTCCGAGNVSFGLPNRGPLTGAFLSMAIGAGLTSAITNPIEEHIKTAIMAADVMTGNDENCLNWIAANREPKPEGKRLAVRDASEGCGGDEERLRDWASHKCNHLISNFQSPISMSTCLIICGALAREVLALKERHRLDGGCGRRAGHLPHDPDADRTRGREVHHRIARSLRPSIRRLRRLRHRRRARCDA